MQIWVWFLASAFLGNSELMPKLSVYSLESSVSEPYNEFISSLLSFIYVGLYKQNPHVR